jgi:hypothetical protein
MNSSTTTTRGACSDVCLVEEPATYEGNAHRVRNNVGGDALIGVDEILSGPAARGPSDRDRSPRHVAAEGNDRDATRGFDAGDAAQPLHKSRYAPATSGAFA